MDKAEPEETSGTPIQQSTGEKAMNEQHHSDGIGIPDEIDVDFTGFAHGGAAIGRYEGRVVFGTGGVAGDRHARVSVDKKNSTDRLIRGQVLSVDEPSPMRGDATCPAAEAGAGCCDFLQVAPQYAAQVKADIFADQLRRIGHLEAPITAMALAPSSGWRTRMRLAVNEDGQAGLRAHSSHEVVAGVPCVQAIDGLLDGVADMRFTPGAEVVLAMDSRGMRHIVELTPSAPRHRREESSADRGNRDSRENRENRASTAHAGAVSDNANPEKLEKPAKNTRRRPHTHPGRRGHAQILEGDGECHQRLSDRGFVLEPTAFWQAHVQAPEMYRAIVRDMLPPIYGGVGWDLYGGVGLFADILAEKTRGPVDSVEVDRSAKKWGRRSLALLDAAEFSPSSIRFVTGKVGKDWSRLRRNSDDRVDLVVADPPRSGAGKAVIRGIAAAKPQAVVHIACDPATGARDFALWAQEGYRLVDVRVLDAFPGTHHMEAIALLQPGAPD